MRLTLRTLLAYLDNVLTPDEAEPLKQRIEESEFASTLVQRIRHSVKRLKLGAPKVDGRGLGFDPNSVSEYLDSTMPADRVVDFEKVCLESDVHLAEVAGCHQILATLFSDHDQVPGELRSRIVALSDRIKPRDGSTSGNNGDEAAAATVVTPPPPPVVERAKPQVPEYLKGDRSGGGALWLLPLGLLALVAIAFFVPPLKQYNPFFNTQEIAQNTDTVIPVTPKAKGKIAEDEEPFEKNIDPTEELPADENPTLPPEVVEVPVEPATSDDLETPPLDPAKVIAEADRVPKSIDPPPRPMPPEGSSEKPPVEPAVAPAADMELGRYISDETVLATYDAKSKRWVRVAPRALVVDGQQLVSLPVYRPQIALSSGAQITFIGETSTAISRASDNNLPLIAMDSGRMLLHTNAVPQVKTEFNFNGITGTLSLDTPESMAAIEVYRYLEPGRDPLADHAEETPSTITVAYLMSVHSTCTWTPTGGEAVLLNENFVHVLINGTDTRLQGPLQLPAWIDAVNTLSIDRDAAKIIDPLLTADRPLDLALQELAGHRRLEVRVLAARCLAFLGKYEPLIEQLSQDEYRPYWMRSEGHLDMFRKQIARGGATAEVLRSELVEARGERDGARLYRLLQGYSQEQLIAREDSTLVQGLIDPYADIRLLSFDNLFRITGKMLNYNPGQPPEKNRSRILAWQDLLEKEAIRYTAAPSPLLEFKPLPKDAAK